MDKHTYQLIINAFSVGTWLQTLGFYFVLGLMCHVALTQLKMISSKIPVGLIAQEEEEQA